MLKVFYQLLLICLFINLSFSQEKILFVGHAYGNPLEKDLIVDPTLKEFLKDKNYKLIYGGDFVQLNEEEEIQNFLEFNSKFNYVLVPGNHDVNIKIFDHQKIRFETYNNSLFIYLNTNFNNPKNIKEAVSVIKKEISKNFKNILIFSHQLFYSESIFDIWTNSRTNYDLCNKFYKEVINHLKASNKNIFIYSGDIGAFKSIPYAYFHKNKNIEYFAVGLGNGINNKAIEIQLSESDEVINKFIDLNSSTREDPDKYSRLRIKLYQLPKLIVFVFKSYYYIVFLPIIIVGYKVLKKILWFC